MKLVIMTKSTFFVEEDKILATLFDEGMDNLHLYKPGSSPLYSERLLTLLSEEYYRKITVHDHFYLKNEYNLAGIHLDNPDTPVPAGYKGRVSRTCTDLSRLKETRKKSEYVFLKNVFGSFDSGDGEPTFTFPQLEEAAKDGLFDRHVYALGGINLENVRTAKELGFGGVVIRDDLWNKFDIQSQTDFKEVIQHFEKLRKAAN